MGAWLRATLAGRVAVDRLLAERRFVYGDGVPVVDVDRFRPHSFVWFHRDLPDEVEVPGRIEVLHRDERVVVVDKPAYLSTIPRGRHILQSVVVRLRDELGLPDLSPVHRLDRVTTGVLLLVTEQEWRRPYQDMFATGDVEKTYLALAPRDDALAWPLTVRNHIRKERLAWRAEVIQGLPVNAETLIEVAESRDDGLAVYRLRPRTGRTHQLRLHLHGLGLSIVDDPLYPEVRDIDTDDYARPLQLLAAELRFTDPVDRTERTFRSPRAFPLVGEAD
jgi:tRNA pseudouridine32 synthase/23S rRNA pseudouridine746 synthase